MANINKWSQCTTSKRFCRTGSYFYTLAVTIDNTSYELQHDTESFQNASYIKVNGQKLSGRDQKPALVKLANLLEIEVDNSWSPQRLIRTIVMTVWRSQNEE